MTYFLIFLAVVGERNSSLSHKLTQRFSLRSQPQDLTCPKLQQQCVEGRQDVELQFSHGAAPQTLAVRQVCDLRLLKLML